jgi:hypothetical protein
MLRPEINLIFPPEPLVPLPTENRSIPPRPPDAAPDPSCTTPEFPPLDDPELNIKAPLTPDCPAFVLRIIMEPLLVAVPSPLDKLRAPPE